MTEKDKIPKKRAANSRSKSKTKVSKKDRKFPPALALVSRVTMTRDGTRAWNELRQKLFLERSDPSSKTSSLLKKRRRKEKPKNLMRRMLEYFPKRISCIQGG